MIESYFIFILFFVLTMYLTTLIRERVRSFPFSDVIRPIIFFVPFIMPVFFFTLPNFILNAGFKAYLIAILSSLIGLSLHYKDFQPYFYKDFYTLLPVLPLKWFIITEISLIGSAVFEEIFYRGFVPKSSLLIEILFSCGLFTVAHFIQKPTRQEFTLKSYIVLFIVSIGWYFSYKISDSLVPSIIGHLLFNAPKIIASFIQYIITRKIDHM
ncbi:MULTISPECIES: CPBP family intramembrane glutamic endopeptidase [Bacillus]|uniref:CPBP family intramembrane glutamic endopeptidase n=1 Tax=Bacillus TaxID=1386 RepID=UPI00028E3840|nr:MULTISPECIES: CPBP family intramembrane glutamic endopeptidase [Bacillus]EKF36482.1 hypothetical protein BA1_05632 [Bacillus xiamenensis]MBD3861254.1 CPBP family intramembrane metalloprotease [Bacillus sp. 28A-2]MCW1837938.1 CPBP family intramembrane metalloprotease [Bacillus xiamenensis]